MFCHIITFLYVLCVNLFSRQTLHYNSYYRNYSLYMYVFGVQTIVTVKQQAVGGVELPHVNLPLQMGMLVVPKQEEEGEGAQQ